MALRHDVVIVGAGPVGASLALGLADADLDVVVLDARQARTTLRGDRSLALSHGARLIFERLGVWGELISRPQAVTPITRIDVSQAGGFGQVRLDARDEGLPALGYVVSYRLLQEALDAALARVRIVVRYGVGAEMVAGTRAYGAVVVKGQPEAVLARLVVVADGGDAEVPGLTRQRHDYDQTALVAKVWTREPHEGLAYERFGSRGPLALLPEQDHYGLIWTATPAEAQGLLELDDGAFLERLGREFGGRRTGFVAVRERRSFPLALTLSSSITSTRTVVIGNAAQALHPVAGQGFNLGLRDAYELGREIVDSAREEIGSTRMLASYARSRRRDRLGGIAFTHGLVGLFGERTAWLRWPRGVALSVLDTVPGAKSAFTRAMLFGLR